MAKQTPLYKVHVDTGARLVDFGGWDMPVNYGSQIEEHHAVRRDAGMFDVSHMTVLELQGDRVRPFLANLLANDIGKLKVEGKALYSCMLAEDGGIIDDLIVYFMDESHFRMVVNAATRDKDLAWINQHAAAYSVTVQERLDLAMIAVQGPQAREKTATLFSDKAAVLALMPFTAQELDGRFIARTGYTGEDGFEILVPAEDAASFWQRLQESGVQPAGLGARDTLRLEAALNLYGQDMDEATNPLESGLGWTVAWEPAGRDFIGREALEKLRAAGVKQRFVGLILEARGVLRSHQKVIVAGSGEGEVTSGTFSPTLEKSIGLARVPVAARENCDVEIRGKLLPAKIVKPPFVRNGEIKV